MSRPPITEISLKMTCIQFHVKSPRDQWVKIRRFAGISEGNVCFITVYFQIKRTYVKQHYATRSTDYFCNESPYGNSSKMFRTIVPEGSHHSLRFHADDIITEYHLFYISTLQILLPFSQFFNIYHIYISEVSSTIYILSCRNFHVGFKVGDKIRTF